MLATPILRRWIITLLALLASGSGCAHFKLKSMWIDGGGPRPSLATHVHALVPSVPLQDRAQGRADWLQMASRRYEQAEGSALHQSAECVDAFYSSALWSWQSFVEQDDAPEVLTGHEPAIRQYNASLARLLREGQRHERLKTTSSLTVHVAGTVVTLPVEYHGFAWNPEDFQECIVVGHYANHTLTDRKTENGVGVPVVFSRQRSPKLPHESDFLPPTACFAATAVLHPDGSSLAFYNPLNTTTAEIDGHCVVLAKDNTASLAYSLHHHSQTRVRDFMRPDRAQAASRLYFLEPYQPDKIPVVFVHGLLSSPDAWADIFNELRSDPEIAAKYQFWAFKYSTGAPFIRSAAKLRSELDAVLERFDPHGENPCIRKGILVGHSMGGLISKLMVAHSGEAVWDSIANLPLEQVATPESTRSALAQRFYFDPHPMVRRVVFIATPHRGSQTAGRAIGKLASSLVVQSDSTFDQLVEDNVGGFQDYVTRGLPTSIDLLNPKQPFLSVLDRLPLSECVSMHSVIGSGNLLVGHHRSDGVVSVESARQAHVESELLVPSTHNGVLRQQKTFRELRRILGLHTDEQSHLDEQSPSDVFSNNESLSSGVNDQAVAIEQSDAMGPSEVRNQIDVLPSLDIVSPGGAPK